MKSRVTQIMFLASINANLGFEFEDTLTADAHDAITGYAMGGHEEKLVELTKRYGALIDADKELGVKLREKIYGNTVNHNRMFAPGKKEQEDKLEKLESGIDADDFYPEF